LDGLANQVQTDKLKMKLGKDFSRDHTAEAHHQLGEYETKVKIVVEVSRLCILGNEEKENVPNGDRDRK
jgi:hypothetical protein